MRYTFAPTSTLCPTDFGLLEPKLVGALPGPGKADSHLAAFFFRTGGVDQEASLTLILEGTEFRNLLGVGTYGPRIKALRLFWV